MKLNEHYQHAEQLSSLGSGQIYWWISGHFWFWPDFKNMNPVHSYFS